MIIISGSNSILARSLVKRFKDEEIYSFDKDIRDIEFIKAVLSEKSPSVFINCTEFHNPDEAEYKQDEAYDINGFAVGKIANICKNINVYFVNISSSRVFGGEGNKPFSEDDVARPESVYGDSKLLGEKLIAQSGCRYLIVRMTDIYGFERSPLLMAIDDIHNGISIDVCRENYISHTYSPDAAGAVYNLVQNDGQGIFHFCQSGYSSTKEYYEWGLDKYYAERNSMLEFAINEIDLSGIPTVAEELKFNVLDTAKYSNFTGAAVRDWKAALGDYITSYLLAKDNQY
ncbi:SDR family oxidoreductase [Spirochaetota bacterium]